jgi:hypothetical protein
MCVQYIYLTDSKFVMKRKGDGKESRAKTKSRVREIERERERGREVERGREESRESNYISSLEHEPQEKEDGRSC